MGSRSLPVLPALAVLLLLSTPLAMAQGGNQRPDELWTFEAEGGATVNDVAIDAGGDVMTAVQADGSAVRTDDDEFFVWNLARSETSSDPDVRDDPSDGLQDPEGLGVVAIHPNPGGKGDYIAVGNEGSSDSNANNVYVYRRTSGGGNENQATYGDDDPPSGAVVDLWFLTHTKLLAYHEDALSLLQRENGTHFEETDAGRWDPTDDTPGNEAETIQDVAVSQSQDRVAVLTSKGGGEATDDTLALHLLEESNGELTRVATTWAREQVDPAGQVALSENGKFVLVATGSNTIYYMGLHDNPDADGPDKRFSEFPWSSNGPDDVTAIELSPGGQRLVAGFANAQLLVYHRTNLTEEGPRAERTLDTPIDTGQAPSEAVFADGKSSLFVQAAGLTGFHERQFQADGEVRPMWALSQARDFAVSDDGQRIVVAGVQDGNGVVQAYEQAYRASLSLDVPSTVQPGRTFNVSATITNEGSTFDAYRLSTSGLDSSWNIENPDEPLALLPGETGNTTLTVTPSRTQAPGEVSFTVKAISQGGPSKDSVASQDTSVTVQEVHAAELSVDKSRRSIGQGSTLEIDVEVRNAGNTAEPIVLRVRQDADWRVGIDGEETSQASFELDPDESTNATVGIQAPSDAPKGNRNTVTLVAHPEGGGSQSEANVPVVVEPSYGAAFEVPTDTVDAEAGSTVQTDVTVLNDGNTRDTFTLDVTSEASNPQHLWNADLSKQKLTLEGGGEETVTVSVSVPRAAQVGDSATITLTATSSATGDEVGEASYELAIPEETDDSPMGVLALLAALGMAALAAGRSRR